MTRKEKKEHFRAFLDTLNRSLCSELTKEGLSVSAEGLVQEKPDWTQGYRIRFTSTSGPFDLLYLFSGEREEVERG